jgi:Na+-driven multidrug efflux pump
MEEDVSNSTTLAVATRAHRVQAVAEEETETISVPTVERILAFAIPAIGVWLCSPLLSMIDTSTVGLLAGTAQQAALNPAVAVTDYSGRTMSFLYVGTTNMMALSQTRDKKSGRVVEASKVNGLVDDNKNTKSSESAQTFCGALQLSVLVGVSIGALLIVLARPMLSSLIGNNASIDPEIMNAAMKYVRIRALGMPAAAFLGTAQAACLGMQDVLSPLLVIAVAALMNLVLDVLLVGQPQAWLGGAAGAAWATLISQYFAAGLFLQWLCRSRSTETISSSTISVANKAVSSTSLLSGRRMWDMFRRRSKTTSQPISQPVADDKNDSFSTRGFLAHRLNWRQLLLPRPTVEIWDGFKPYVIPVTTTQVGRCSAYIALGHTVSSCFGTVSMAANQIITSIFYALIPIADSLGLTAQSFLPAMVAQPPSRNRTVALQQFYWNL